MVLQTMSHVIICNIHGFALACVVGMETTPAFEEEESKKKEL